MDAKPLEERRRLRRALRSHGRRFSRQLALIYEFLCSTRSHPTAEQVLEWLGRRARPPTDLAAVEESLATLVDCKLVQRLASGFAPIHYDADVRNHPHLADEEQGILMDLPVEMADKLGLKIPPEVLADIRERTGFKVTALRLELVGRRDRRTPKPPPPPRGK